MCFPFSECRNYIKTTKAKKKSSEKPVFLCIYGESDHNVTESNYVHFVLWFRIKVILFSIDVLDETRKKIPTQGILEETSSSRILYSATRILWESFSSSIHWIFWKQSIQIPLKWAQEIQNLRNSNKTAGKRYLNDLSIFAEEKKILWISIISMC